MSQDRARKVSAVREQASAAITAAIAELNSMANDAERLRHLRGIATLLVGQPEGFKAIAILQCPELEAAEPFPDTLLDTKEQELVSHLTPSNLKAIDGALLASSGLSWRKAPRVIGGAMVIVESHVQRLPPALYVQRLVALVETGELLAGGNIAFMRLSEVRLPATEAREA